MGDYTRSDVVHALRELGVCEGDVLFTHSNVGFFGCSDGATSAQGIYTLFKSAIFEVIGTSGTWIVPTFSWSFCRKKDFDVAQTPGEGGMLAESLRTDPDALRSHDANFSVAAVGAKAKYFTEHPPEYSFGRDSFWERFRNHGGLICNFNFDAGSTFIHYVERCLRVPYRYDKGFSGTLIDGTSRQEKTFYHFVYDLEKREHAPDFTRFDAIVKERGTARVHNVGKGQILCISSEDTYVTISDQLAIDPYFLTIQNRSNTDGFGR